VMLLDMKRAAGILGISIWTLRDLVWDRVIPAYRIGKKDFIKSIDLKAFVENLDS
jgi:excisionase family DNA binding protein